MIEKIKEKYIAITTRLKEKFAPAAEDAEHQGKKLKIIAALLSSLFFLIFVTPLFFDNSALKFQIQRKVAENFGANLQIKGDVEVMLLPSPRIVLNQAFVRNYKPDFENLEIAKIYNFYAKQIIIKLPLLNFGKIKEVIFASAMVERYSDNGSADVRENNLIAKFSEIGGFTDDLPEIGSGISGKIFNLSEVKISKDLENFPNFIFENSQVFLYDEFGRKQEIKKITASLQLSKDRLESVASFESENILSELEADLKFNSSNQKADSFLNINSPASNLTIKGNFTSENKLLSGILENNFKGEMLLKIIDLKTFYRTYFNPQTLLAQRLRYNATPITISSNISINEKLLSAKNLQIDSSLIDGAGKIDLSKRDKNIWVIDLALDLKNLDLDKIWSKEFVPLATVSEALQGDQKTVGTAVKQAVQNINLSLTKDLKNFDLGAEIKIENVKYLNGQLNNVNLYLSASKEGKILVMPMIFEVLGSGKFRVNGVIDNNEAHPKFIGKIDAFGKDLGEIFKWLQIKSQNLKFDNLKNYTFFSDLMLIPNSIFLSNIYLSLNNDGSEMVGEIKIDNFGKSTNSFGSFRFSKFDIDDYFFTSAQNIYLSPGSLLKKVLWLNNVNIGGDFKLYFDRLIYKDEIFRNQNTHLRFGNGFFAVDEVVLRSNNIDLDASLSLDISGSIPNINLFIKGKKFDYKTKQVSFLNKEGALQESTSRNFFDQFYALPALDEFIGKAEIEIEDLKIDGVDLGKANFAGTLKDGNFNNARAAFTLYDGDFSYTGLLALKLRKTINGKFTLNNTKINPVLIELLGIDNVYGVANVTGNITAIADKKSEFFKELTSEIKFSVAAPYITNYGLSDLVVKMLYPKRFAADLKNPEGILNNENAISKFDSARGGIVITRGIEKSKLKVDVKAKAMNAILSGDVDLNKKETDLFFNAIFVTGDKKNKVPINIASNIKSKNGEVLSTVNIDQVKQYLGLMKAPVKEQEKSVLLPVQIKN